MMKQLGRLISIITWLLIIGGIVIISGGLLGRPLLVAAVPTTSMVPVLQPGDLIVVLPTWSVGHPGLGDIVVYKTPEDRNWIVHRIVDGNASDGFITKGDANHVSDPHPVHPRDMAGVVPQWRGGAVKFPRLGALRLDSGPLSSPFVAGIALVSGIFLVLMDMQPVRSPRMRYHSNQRARPASILLVYLGLAGTAFFTTLIPAWALSTDQLAAYEIIEQRPSNVIPFGRYLPGEVHEEKVVVSNPSPLPLLVVFSSDMPSLTYAPWYAIVPIHGQVTFTATIRDTTLGHHEGSIRTGVFLPLLPSRILGSLARKSLVLAALLASLVPAAQVLCLALFDMRARIALSQYSTKLTSRFVRG